MGGKMEWAALEFIVEILGIEDVEAMIDNIQEIADYRAAAREKERQLNRG